VGTDGAKDMGKSGAGRRPQEQESRASEQEARRQRLKAELRANLLKRRRQQAGRAGRVHEPSRDK